MTTAYSDYERFMIRDLEDRVNRLERELADKHDRVVSLEVQLEISQSRVKLAHDELDRLYDEFYGEDED